MAADLQIPDRALLPRHVAVIMDGNGRWAADRGLPRLEGHREGAERVREIVTFARELGIGYLTLYAFSRQNWCRPPAEVAGLMRFLRDFCISERNKLCDNDIRATLIGSMAGVPDSTRDAIAELIDATAGNKSMTVCMALDYGGREELVRATRKLADDVAAKRLRPDDIDEAHLERALDTAHMPDPDLLIRTSGEQRLSNFLLWQVAYTELYFCPCAWPEFTRPQFAAALQSYVGRERRFGATSEQLAAPPGPTPAPSPVTRRAGTARLRLAKRTGPA